MPKTSGYLLTCPYPFSCDVYKGCTHKCKYCFANRRSNISDREAGAFQSVKHGEPFAAIEAFVNGHRSKRDSWCDWNAPLQFGTNADPFPPIEIREGRMLRVLKMLASKRYPFIVTTKGANVISSREYLAVLKDCNACVQISMSSPAMDRMEPGAPSFSERVAAMEKLSGVVPRTVARAQPFFLEHAENVARSIRALADAGVYGILVEPLYPSYRQISPLQVKSGGMWHYTYDDARAAFAKMRKEAHKVGLKFVATSVQQLTDEPILCCTCGPMDGFIPNKCNLAYYHLKPREYKATPRMMEIGTGDVFNVLRTPRKLRANMPLYRTQSFKTLMDWWAKDEGFRERITM